MRLQIDYTKRRKPLIRGRMTGRHENTANGVSFFMDSYL